MDVTLVNIDANPAPSALDYPVVITLEIDGQQETFDLKMRPTAFPELGAGLLVPGEALTRRLQDHQDVLNRLSRVVARQLEGTGVHLPQLIAA